MVTTINLKGPGLWAPGCTSYPQSKQRWQQSSQDHGDSPQELFQNQEEGIIGQEPSFKGVQGQKGNWTR